VCDELPVVSLKSSADSPLILSNGEQRTRLIVVEVRATRSVAY